MPEDDLEERFDDHPATAQFRAADGTLVVEADLRRGGAASLPEIVELARAAGADAVWVHAAAVDAALGFEQRGGYARLSAERLPSPVEVTFVPHAEAAGLQSACFAGVWGHAEPEDPPDPETVFVGLRESGALVGICAVDLAERWIDGPGLLPGHRSAGRFAQLVQAAATLLGHGPAFLESWGDEAETVAAYEALGFELVDYVSGWELRL